MTIESRSEKARVVLLQFLKSTNDIFEMKQKLIRYYQIVLYGQRKLKAYLLRYKKRVDALSEIWEMVKGEMIKESMTKKSSKKKQALVPKLTALSDEVKAAILKVYLGR